MNNHNPTPMRHHFLQPLLLFLMLFVALPTLAQELKENTMYLDETDATAQDGTAIPEMLKNDPSKRYGLVKVRLALNNATFEGLTYDVTKKTGEYWVWVVAGDDGAHTLKINHNEFKPLEVNFDKYKIESIEHKRTYVLEIEVPDKGGKFDYSTEKTLYIKVSPPEANLYWGGSTLKLNQGEAETTIFKGQIRYSVEASKYYSIEDGVLNFDDVKNKDTLKIELKPKMGKLRVRPNPSSAIVYVDGKRIDKPSSEPIELQVGEHQVRVEAKKYATMERTVNIELNETSSETFSLIELNTFNFTSSPSGASISINDKMIGTTPFTTEDYTTGTYKIKATKEGYLNFEEEMKLETENILIKLMKDLNSKNDKKEFYAEGNVKAGSFMGFGATIGGYIMNINAEVAYLVGSGKSETIYWSGNNTPPIGCTYTPSTNFTFKLGYGIPLSNRYRLTPQAGIGMVKLKETIEEGNGASPADGANTTMGLVGVRFSAAIADHIGVSISPEFGFSMSKSKGFEALSEVSSDIKKWGEGFNVKLGLTAFF